MGRPSGMRATILAALEDVQMTSLIAFTAAELFTYVTTKWSGYFDRKDRNASGGQRSASEQLALRSGSSTWRAGLRIFAVSAMKWTPQNTMTSADVLAACWASASESPTKSATSWISPSW